MSAKLQRWTDLLAALLRRQFPVTLEQLCAEVPDYARGTGETLRRKFERDKDELRAFGIPIETVRNSSGELLGYRLRPADFYLPYLATAGAPAPRKVNRDRFRALPTLTFEPEELFTLAQAANRAEAAGLGSLADHIRSARRKLAADLPMDAVAGADPEHLVPPRTRADSAVFDAVDDALRRRKRITFEYYAIGADTTSSRTVDPFGLFFLGQHWYLAGREPGGDVVKNFRLSRVSRVQINGQKPDTPDFTLPEDFQLRDHARSRQAWELGDGDEVTAEIVFARDHGGASAAAQLGQPVPDHPSHRRFRVRRMDPFVRWLLSLGGAARPISPPELVAAWRDQLQATLDVYQGATP